MLDVTKIYNDPIISRKRKGTHIDPFVKIKESLTVDAHYVLLSEIPNRYDRVKATMPNTNIELHEVTGENGDYRLRENEFRVDYTEGIVYVHESLLNKTIDFEYTGEGVYLFPDSRVYYSGDKKFPNLRDKLIDIDRSILVERHRIDEQIMSHPQPSEVVDMRIDYNGKIFRVTKDRIDAEQRKIEEAYYDANGKKYGSLKERIDSLQLVVKEENDEQKRENSKIWSEIRLIPGEIALEVGRVEEKLNDEVRKLQSQINMTPEQISLKVQELKEYADGKFESSFSQINMLSDQLELKVDSNGVIAAVNLSKEGIRLKGNKIHLDGQAKIDDAVIKSAHIESISADKLKAGTIDTSLINVKNSNDPDRYALLDHKGLYIKGGALTIERDDGYKSIIDGKLNFNFSVFPAEPSFKSSQVETHGYFYRTKVSTDPQNMQFYTLRHEGRYLKLHVAYRMDNHAGTTSGGIYVVEPGSGEILLTKIFRNQGSDSYESVYGEVLTLDMGTPTGVQKGFYVRLKSGSSSRYAYGRIIRIWQEG